MDWAKTTSMLDGKHLSFGIWCDLYFEILGRPYNHFRHSQFAACYNVYAQLSIHPYPFGLLRSPQRQWSSREIYDIRPHESIKIVIQSRAVITQPIFYKIITKAPHNSPVRARYEVSFVSLKSDLSSAAAIALLDVISWYIASC